MKIVLQRPIVIDGQVIAEQTTVEVPEQHGRSLLAKGYAKAAESPPEKTGGKKRHVPAASPLVADEGITTGTTGSLIEPTSSDDGTAHHP